MREVAILLPKGVYSPGDSITGILEVTTDKEFDSKSTSITFDGRIKASVHGIPSVSRGKIQQQTGKINSNIVEGTIVLAEDKHYPEGKHTFNFSFDLPTSECTFQENLYIKSGMFPSHKGSVSSVEYMLYAAVEISSFTTLRAQIPITIIVPLDEYPKIVKNERSLKDVIFLETDSDLFCIGKPYEVRYRIKEGAKVKKIQLELVNFESVSSQGLFASSSISLYKTEIIRQGRVSEWQTIVLEPDVEIPQSFKCDVLVCTLQLNVTAELGRFKKVQGKLSLLAHHCPDTERTI
ncbi:MAG: hypothetical protein ACXAC0_06455 [Candidatus Thorarchaeota archaeon]|jgi:hypothetical protein